MVSRVNLSRVVLAGLLAGLIMIVVEMAFHAVRVGASWWFFQALFYNPIDQALELGSYAGMYLLKGIALMWLYALAIPRYGPGRESALFATGVFWIVGYALPVVSFEPLMVAGYGTEMLRVPAMVALGEALFGALGSAHVYRESLPEDTPVANYVAWGVLILLIVVISLARALV